MYSSTIWSIWMLISCSSAVWTEKAVMLLLHFYADNNINYENYVFFPDKKWEGYIHGWEEYKYSLVKDDT